MVHVLVRAREVDATGWSRVLCVGVFGCDSCRHTSKCINGESEQPHAPVPSLGDTSQLRSEPRLEPRLERPLAMITRIISCDLTVGTISSASIDARFFRRVTSRFDQC